MNDIILGTPPHVFFFWKEEGETPASIVDHILGGCTELLISLDHLVHGIKEVLLCHGLPSSSDGVHSSFCADTPNIGPCKKRGIVFRKVFIKMFNKLLEPT